MAKEALFNILNHQVYLHGMEILELYAGSGNMSYEFASRGASSITAVDQELKCVKFIEKTAAELDLNIHAIKSDAVSHLEKSVGKYDIIFADPPYALSTEEFLQIPDLVFGKQLLKEGGLLIIEHSKHTDLESHPRFSNARRYGGTVFSFFEESTEE
jgi:16S rRNA (guanine(966)-N(2))-methyltransferase RsmD